MGVWNALGGNKIGPGHPRYERELRKEREFKQLTTQTIIMTILTYSLPKSLKYESERDIIAVLKRYPDCPRFDNWGERIEHVNNWKQAQKWLKDKERKENPEPVNPEYQKFTQAILDSNQEIIKTLKNTNTANFSEIQIAIDRNNKKIEELELKLKNLERKIAEYENE